ncbi:MAG TPA: beta-glucosidase BglX [Bacteroidales bacterium]|nr:beta-glucosidase BglX [Bacteroidales bacterium]HNS47727.1 beta-glucosidase BglX [Bacteroidales bacterium]
MKSRPLFLTALILLSFLVCYSQKNEISADLQMRFFIDELMRKMTLEEKLGQLNLPAAGDITTGQASSSNIGMKVKSGQVGGLLNIKSVEKIREVQRVAVEESRLGIPLIFGMDVIHGYQTTFPIPLGLAASFDPELIERSARVAAVEASADGICWTFSPMVDIARDPRWGRIAEGAGEDPFLGSRVAEAYVRGYQADDLMKENTILACVKHYALYGAAEAGRDYNTADMSRIRMFNEYLPPYQAAVRAGVGSVMTSFNEVDGIPATGNKWLMTDVLRDQWGFDGFVVTDYTAINEMIAHGMGDLQAVSALALRAGVDMDMVGEGFLTTLLRSLKEGKVTEAQIDQACRRILETKYKLGLFDDPYRYCDLNRPGKDIATEEHTRIARETAARTFVLLKNEDQLLPLEKKGKIALIGPLADNRENMAGMWSVAVDHRESVTVLEGFRSAVGSRAEVVYVKGSNIVDDPRLDRWINSGPPGVDPTRTPEELRKEAVDLASSCDAIVAVMGEAAEMSGESSCRSDISLPGSQRQLLKALLETGKPVVLVLFTGRPLTLTWEQEHLTAILNVWFGGTQAGNAIADVIFGEVNPSGKLPVTFPQNIGQIPLYYNHKSTGRPLAEGEWYQKYRSNYVDVTNEPLYPFGFGLSFTRFSYDDLVLDKTPLSGNQTLTASIDITNTGNYDGSEVVQLYIQDLVGSITRPVKELKGFQKVFIKAGETKTVTFRITPEDLKFYNYDLVYDWEPGEFVIMVGGNSRDVNSGKVFWEK